MIYLKNIREKQTVHIPRTEINSKVVVIKSYDEGYADGIAEGKKLQKLKLTNLTVSENGVYKREDGWNEVEVDVPEVLLKTQEKNVTVSKDVSVVLPDSGYDAITKVSVNATQYGQNKRNEGYEDGYNAGNQKGYTDGKAEGYEDGKVEGYTEGKNDGIEEGYSQGYADGKAEGGSITTKPLYAYPKWEDKNLVGNIVYRPETYNTQAFSLVTVNVETLYSEGVEEGYTQGKTDGYNQGYNEGYEEGKESGSTTSKIKVFDYGVNIEGSTFTTIPEWMDFTGATDFGEAFRDCEKLTVVNNINTDSATSMRYMFWNCKSLATVNISAPNVTTMEYMFVGCNKLTSPILTFTSNVREMGGMFQDCWMLTSLPLFTTSKALGLGRMFDGCFNLTNVENLKPNAARTFYNTFRKCTKLTSIPALNASNLEWGGADLFGDIDLPNLTDFGGLVGLKMSSNSNEGFVRTPNLTLESCLNILNGLYDFTGNGVTPTFDQGKLKVHQNFLNLVGNQISIATSKGWTITA